MTIGRISGATILTIFLLFGTRSADAAIDQVTLGPAYQGVTFVGNGDDVQVVLGDCTSSTCTLSGPIAFWTGTPFAFGPFSITTASTNTITLTQDLDGLWLLHALAPLSFRFGLGGTLLTGDINLFSVQQSPNTLTAVFNHHSNTLTNLGGSLASNFGPAGAIIDWTVAFSNYTDLASLLGDANRGHTILSQFSSGEIVPTPEPGTLLLIGTGMVLIGGMLRPRRRADESKTEQAP
jgi:hypothetical protein